MNKIIFIFLIFYPIFLCAENDNDNFNTVYEYGSGERYFTFYKTYGNNYYVF